MKCKCKKFCRKAEPILSFSYQNIITGGKQTWGRSKHVHHDERFLSLSQIDKPYHELIKWNMLIKLEHLSLWPKCTCISIADVWTVNRLVQGTYLD